MLLADFVPGNWEWYMDFLDPSRHLREQYTGLFLTWKVFAKGGELSWVGSLPRTLRLIIFDRANAMFLEHDYPMTMDGAGIEKACIWRTE